ncbi:unnamed protein product [Brugia pahangi]|uniref:Uncharacterized protein n=1 Tax=Brugia pahangi TaxID=6280 RepID=A0A0N4T5X7_BRUPA|nr:unnamed protein product [Brugia pahangi]
MFAPDGSLIKKNATIKEIKKTKFQTETNQIYEEDRLNRNDGNSRETRGTRIRAADGPIIYDDYDFYPDEKQTNINEENMIATNFLRINTIPELPPQHESIYEGMFAPDGSLIKKNATIKEIKKTKFQTETNQIYEEDRLNRNDGNSRETRGTRIRAADGPIIYDDYDFYPIITSSELEIPSFNDTTTTTITTTKETIELNPNVKSSTLTRLQVLISGENDRFAKKNFNFGKFFFFF